MRLLAARLANAFGLRSRYIVGIVPLQDKTMRDTFKLLASYNEWMNAKIYDAAGSLPYSELTADRGAFFGSVLGTLNHLVVGDRIWLRRFSSHPANHAALDPLSQYFVASSRQRRGCN